MVAPPTRGGGGLGQHLPPRFLGQRLAARFGIGVPWTRAVAGLAYALSPIALSIVGQYSGEYLPMAMLPWILLPLAGAVREVARRVGNDFSIQEVRPMEDVVAAAVATERFALQMVGLFAVVALALALIGVYGVISYTVSRRSREIAIRSAIGAQPDDILRLLLGQVAKPILAGLIVGGFASASLTRILAGMLYQVSAKDPLTFAGVAFLLALGALAACLAPARRALRLDPMVVLRSE